MARGGGVSWYGHATLLATMHGYSSPCHLLVATAPSCFLLSTAAPPFSLLKVDDDSNLLGQIGGVEVAAKMQRQGGVGGAWNSRAATRWVAAAET